MKIGKNILLVLFVLLMSYTGHANNPEYNVGILPIKHTFPTLIGVYGIRSVSKAIKIQFKNSFTGIQRNPMAYVGIKQRNLHTFIGKLRLINPFVPGGLLDKCSLAPNA